MKIRGAIRKHFRFFFLDFGPNGSTPLFTFMRDEIIQKIYSQWSSEEKWLWPPSAASWRHLTGIKAAQRLTWLLLLELRRYEYIFSWSVITVTVHISFNSRPPPPPLPFPTSPHLFRTSPPSPNSSYDSFSVIPYCLSPPYFMEILLQGKYIIIVCVAIWHWNSNIFPAAGFWPQRVTCLSWGGSWGWGGNLVLIWKVLKTRVTELVFPNNPLKCY